MRIFGFCGDGRPGRGGRRAAGVLLAAGLLVTAFGSAAMAASPRHEAAAVTGSLSGVACTSTSNCVAVGARTVSSGSSTLAEKWNGTKWSVVTSPNPKGSTGAELKGVACTSSKNCLAVGEYFMPGVTLPTAEKWNGSKWSVLTVPLPSGSPNGSLFGVSCVSATDCQAVGFSTNNTLTLAETWNGSKWSVEPSANLNPAKTEGFDGVACPSAKDCWAVGLYFPTNYSSRLTEQWNGKKWSVVSTVTSKSSQLFGDACFSASACMSVGIGGISKLFAIAQVWKGSSWAATTPAEPSGAANSSLNGVSCPASSSCEAVGSWFNSSVTATLGEGWNGTKWAVQTMPAISGSTYTALANISCPAKTSCWAVGESLTPSGVSTPVIEKWNGKTWSVSAS